MATYTAEVVKDLSTTTPTEGATPPSEMNDSVREVKRILKNYNALTLKSADYTVTTSDCYIRCATSGVNITLPDPATVASTASTKHYIFHNSSTTVTWNIIGVISGITNPVMQPKSTMIIFTNGTTWWELKPQEAYNAEDSDTVDLCHATDLEIHRLAKNFNNLIITNNATNPNYQVDVNADEEILFETTTGASKKFTTADLTISIATSGANGLDTGSEAASTWYHIWVIGKTDGTKAGLLSLSSTAPTMPSGYTYKAYAGAIYNDASSNFIKIYQKEKWVARDTRNVLTAGTATTPTAIDITTAVPPTAKKAIGLFWIHYVSTNRNLSVCARVSSTNLNIFTTNTTTNDMAGAYQIININNEIYYFLSGAGSEGNVDVSAWEF